MADGGIGSGVATWVFHRGSLGDSVLLWPVLRALKAGGEAVTLVTDGSKAALAARELGIAGDVFTAIGAEQRRFNELWIKGARPQACEGVARVLAFGPSEADEAGRVWLENARAMFPGAAIETFQRRVDRRLALELAGRFGRAVMPAVRSNPGGPAIMHVGAGSNEKRWPLRCWGDLASRLGERLGGVTAIAGEVEAERFTPEERRGFDALVGRFLPDLITLAEVLKGARVYVGCDTGPTHLAAALGVPTLGLFGPTDPDQWGPIGPRVQVITAPGGGMARLDATAVLRALPA